MKKPKIKNSKKKAIAASRPKSTSKKIVKTKKSAKFSKVLKQNKISKTAGPKIKKSASSKVKLVQNVKVAAEEPKKPIKKGMNKIWVDVLLPDPRVRKWLVQAIGENSIHVIREFDRELSDEDISKKTELRASDVRVVLNRLHANSLASYSRSRDKTSGWYSYNWRLDEQHAHQLANGLMSEEKELKVTGGEGERYYCIIDGEKVIYTFEEAMQNDFKCPKSGQPLKFLE